LRKYRFLVPLVLLLSGLAFMLQPSAASAARSFELSFAHRPIREPSVGDSCSSPTVDLEEWAFRRFRSRRSRADFVASARRADAATITGVFVCDVLALQVTQQPANDPIFVAETSDTVTQSRLAADYGTIGLLAHNHLSGSRFFNLALGQEVDIVYGDGTFHQYVISEIRHLQALDPDSPYSDFSDLDNAGPQLSSTQVFEQFFGGGDRVVFQTCISANGILSWGRLFVTARPVSTY